MSEDDFDAIVVGSGPGGYVAALRMAQLKLRVACIERSPRLGGTCLNVGCIPSKSLLHSSHLAHLVEHEAKENGLKVSTEVDFAQMQRRKEKIVSTLTAGVSGLFERHKVARVEGEAKLLSNRQVEVAGRTLTARSIVLATGSIPHELPFMPCVEGKIIDSTGALALKEIPKKMIVIGAGVIGLELASVYARLGSQVVVLEMLEQICPGTDHTAALALSKSLKKLGIDFHLGVRVKSGEAGENGVKVIYEEKGREVEIDGDVALVAVGRKPYWAGLGLDSAGVRVDGRGRVEVDGRFESSLKGVYAIGDLIDGPMLAHKASEEGVAVAEIIAGLSPVVDYISIPNIVYTSPELASVGLAERTAIEMGVEVVTGSYPLKANPRALCTGETEGLVKVVADKRSRRLVGLHIVASQASEMISVGSLALKSKTTLEQLAELTQAHPTLSEAIKEACLQALGRAIHL